MNFEQITNDEVFSIFEAGLRCRAENSPFRKVNDKLLLIRQDHFFSIFLESKNDVTHYPDGMFTITFPSIEEASFCYELDNNERIKYLSFNAKQFKFNSLAAMRRMKELGFKFRNF